MVFVKVGVSSVMLLVELKMNRFECLVMLVCRVIVLW